ncbi:hypothetical protein SOVF_119070, partial [Spinacia oleracea]
MYYVMSCSFLVSLDMLYLLLGLLYLLLKK